MKKAIVLLCVLAVVATASAKIEIFLKEGGVNQYVYDGWAKNYMPYFDGQTSPVVNIGQCIVPTPNVALDRTLFVWGRYVNEPYAQMIQGLGFHIFTGPGTAVGGCDTSGVNNLSISESMIFLHRRATGATSVRWTRWNRGYADPNDPNSNPTPQPGINSPVAAVTTRGIENTFDAAIDLITPNTNRHWDDSFGDWVYDVDFLIGAIHVTSPAGQAPVGAVYIGGHTTAGMVSFRNDGPDQWPEVNLGLGGTYNVQQYNNGSLGTPVMGPAGQYIGWKPEPATLLLIGLGLLLRRR